MKTPVAYIDEYRSGAGEKSMRSTTVCGPDSRWISDAKSASAPPESEGHKTLGGRMVRTNVLPSVTELADKFVYDAEIGTLTWRVSPRGGVAALSPAGCNNWKGYRAVRLNNVLYKVSRIAWKMSRGTDPAGFIDHINGDTSDNRAVNLRDATNQQNTFNATVRRKSAYPKGVVKYSGALGEKYRAYIMLDGRSRFLGSFLTPDQAHMAYCAAACELHGEFANSGVRNNKETQNV
jgi:hypothetical protein